ncbi:MAG: transcriptional regulator [Bacteroidetes bacterium GWA2_31_9]|nr:MAG: transcriptional regulator [Bacteroidetes bacterium GWA2_31_9]
MNESKIILTSIPQSDGLIKLRPTLVLRKMPLYGDLLVCGISTQIAHYIPEFDEIISETDSDFKSSGLLQKSLIRLSFLTILPQKNIKGSIGQISEIRYNKLINNLSAYISKGEFKNN